MRIALNAQKLSFAQAYQAGGISRYIYNLLRELRRLASGHSFEAFAPGSPTDSSLADTEHFRITPTGKATERPAARVLWEQVVLPARLLGRCDLLHGLAFALPLAWTGRAVVTVLDLSFLRHPQAFNRGNRLYLTLSTILAVRRADRVLTISEHGRREVIQLLGVSPDRVTATLCAADEQFRPLPPAEVEAFRRRRGLPERFILYLGTLEPRKNVATLLQAYARLRADLQPAPALVLAGSPGWLYEEVFSTIERLGLRDHVLLPGFVAADEQPLWYNAAAVFAYPSLYEGFGLPPLEAMACGIPVVASDASSLPEVVGEAGLLVPPRDDSALAASLRRVLEEDALASHLRRAGPERAAQFSWRRMALETLRCYEEVAGRA
jgi:glycosyltransferase involved in cell wall biosynthesis